MNMKKFFKTVITWICSFADMATTIKDDDRVVGRVYLFHTGSIACINVVYNQRQKDETTLSLTTNSSGMQ